MLVERTTDDRRQFPRYSVDWQASIKMGDTEIYHDRIYDISLGGAAIYTDENIITNEPLVMLIETPVPHFQQKTVVARIECKMRHAVLPPGQSRFYIGMHFLHFQGLEKHLLAEAFFNRPTLPVRRAH
jgi:c-di-GMP-binding flagellar brake protein YcgR